MAKWNSSAQNFAKLQTDSPVLYRHVRTGDMYVVLCDAYEVTTDVATLVTVYRNVEQGTVYVQERERFYDGRFEKIS
jgi:hypothetical protein